MKRFKSLLIALLCCAVCGTVLSGCSGGVKQDPGTGGKGLSTQEKADKKGDTN